MGSNAKNCAIIPAYNEEENIYEVVSKAKKYGFLPIVIDDNSDDRTSEIAKKSGAIVIKNKTNRGKGEALKTGIEYVLKNHANLKNLVFIDADMQYDPEGAMSLVEPLENKSADIVMGFRDWSKVPFRHKLGNFVWRASFNTLFGTNLKDTNCGFMSMTTDAAKILKDALYGGYIIESAILSYAVKKHLKIGQVPVKVLYKSKSDVKRGLRMVGGVLIFILIEGLKYRLSESKI